MEVTGGLARTSCVSRTIVVYPPNVSTANVREMSIPPTLLWEYGPPLPFLLHIQHGSIGWIAAEAFFTNWILLMSPTTQHKSREGWTVNKNDNQNCWYIRWETTQKKLTILYVFDARLQCRQRRARSQLQCYHSRHCLRGWTASLPDKPSCCTAERGCLSTAPDDVSSHPVILTPLPKIQQKYTLYILTPC